MRLPRAIQSRPRVLAAASGLSLGLGASVLLQQFAVWTLTVWTLVVLPVVVAVGAVVVTHGVSGAQGRG